MIGKRRICFGVTLMLVNCTAAMLPAALVAGARQPAAGQEHNHAWRVLGQLHDEGLQSTGSWVAASAGVGGTGAAETTSVTQVRVYAFSPLQAAN
jgi:hypothetical protein